ncbi:MAG: dephospho-CoA kinase [Armatimonadetes bacterium]|nr:dephospho-CoA kinase [Armatimonadota bacterium]MDE2205971.1 dephospho-CoA kinase [Armatimonadota bacterium]
MTPRRRRRRHGCPAILVGITGSIGVGKSTALAAFRSSGARVLDADDDARAVVRPGGRTLRAISDAFGSDLIAPDGTLRRGTLAERVFGKPLLVERLNQITHPAIRRRLRRRILRLCADSPADSVIAVEIPLLFESGLESWFDTVVVIGADRQTQIHRLVNRDACSAEVAAIRITAQWSFERKAELADLVVNNNGSLRKFERSIQLLCRNLVEARRTASQE